MYHFFVKPEQISGDRAVITGPDVNHIGNVLRMKPGEKVLLSAGEDYTVKMKVQFHRRASEPVLAMTIRDKQGTDICGTNTMFESFDTGEVRAGDVREISFTQRMDLKDGEYLVCLGCTGFKDGDFEVFHRLYDAFLIRVVSSRTMVGFFDLQTRIAYGEE